MNSNPRPSSPTDSVLRAVDLRRIEYRESDGGLFQSQLRDFVPPRAFDVHAHLYDLNHLVSEPTDFAGKHAVTHEVLAGHMRRWMGDRVITDGLYFPFPLRGLDPTPANHFLSRALGAGGDRRALMLIRPRDEPAVVERDIEEYGFVGFKVYHVFSERVDSFHAEPQEFLPDWAWQLANERSLVIMLHLVLPRALSDERNQQFIRERCLQFPRAKLVLAHAARGFNANHTVASIRALRGLENVWFDTSAVCEPSALEAILETFGTTRLMYGSDFPVSEMRGRSVSVGDGFLWLHDDHAVSQPSPTGKPELVGIEALLALRQACRTLKLVDRDVERIFCENARQLLDLPTSEASSGSHVQSLYREAKTLIPGGTQLLSKRPEMFAPDVWPAYYEEAVGCEVVDSDGRRLIDMSHCGILACILGYADPDVNAAVIRRVHLGNMATQQTADELELARRLIKLHPWADQARFTRSGGEAMAVAVRIARAATQRNKLVVCGYHGWHDWYLAANLDAPMPVSGAARALDAHLLPGLDPTGVPAQLAGSVVTFPYNQLDRFHQAIEYLEDDLAAIVMEPTRGTDPTPGFLEAIRAQADELSVPLIFDEISSAWRTCLGGVHRHLGVEPDLAVFAKGMSNGYAMGAIIGRRHVMQACETSFISSTYWTEGIGPAAAVAAIKKMERENVPAHLNRLGAQVMRGWRHLAQKHQLCVTVSGRPSSCVLTFDHPNSASLMTLMTTRMLDRGFLAAANCSLTWAHQDHHVQRYLSALDEVFSELAKAIAAGDVEARLKGPVKHAGFQRLTEQSG